MRRSGVGAHRAVKAGRSEDEWRVIGEPADIDVVLVDILEISHHLFCGFGFQQNPSTGRHPRKHQISPSHTTTTVGRNEQTTVQCANLFNEARARGLYTLQWLRVSHMHDEKRANSDANAAITCSVVSLSCRYPNENSEIIYTSTLSPLHLLSKRQARTVLDHSSFYARRVLSTPHFPLAGDPQGSAHAKYTEASSPLPVQCRGRTTLRRRYSPTQACGRPSSSRAPT